MANPSPSPSTESQIAEPRCRPKFCCQTPWCLLSPLMVRMNGLYFPSLESPCTEDKLLKVDIIKPVFTLLIIGGFTMMMVPFLFKAHWLQRIWKISPLFGSVAFAILPTSLQRTRESRAYTFLAVRIAESLSQLTAGWDTNLNLMVGGNTLTQKGVCVKKKPNSGKCLALFGPPAEQGRAWTWGSPATQNGGDEARILAAAKASWVVWFMLVFLFPPILHSCTRAVKGPGSEPWLELSQCRLQNLFTHNVLPRPGMKFQAQNLRIQDRSSCEFGSEMRELLFAS